MFFLLENDLLPGDYEIVHAVEVSSIIGMLAIEERDSWELSVLGSVLPLYRETWIEWAMDAENLYRAGAFVVRHDIAKEYQEHAIDSHYIDNIIATIQQETNFNAMDFTAFINGEANPPASHVITIVLWYGTEGNEPIATHAYFLYLDKAGVAIDTFIIALDMTKKQTDDNSLHNALPVLYALAALQTSKWCLIDPCYITSTGVTMRRAIPLRLH